MEWISFPAREEPKKSASVAIFIVIFSFLIGIEWGGIFGILSIILLLLSLLPYFTPTHYTLNEDEIIVKKAFYTIKKQWKNIRSFYPDKNGVLLSPFSEETRLENYRGMYLRFNKNREEVISFLKKKLGKSIKDGGKN